MVHSLSLAFSGFLCNGPHFTLLPRTSLLSHLLFFAFTFFAFRPLSSSLLTPFTLSYTISHFLLLSLSYTRSHFFLLSSKAVQVPPGCGILPRVRKRCVLCLRGGCVRRRGQHDRPRVDVPRHACTRVSAGASKKPTVCACACACVCVRAHLRACACACSRACTHRPCNLNRCNARPSCRREKLYEKLGDPRYSHDELCKFIGHLHELGATEDPGWCVTRSPIHLTWLNETDYPNLNST